MRLTPKSLTPILNWLYISIPTLPVSRQSTNWIKVKKEILTLMAVSSMNPNVREAKSA